MCGEIYLFKLFHLVNASWTGQHMHTVMHTIQLPLSCHSLDLHMHRYHGIHIYEGCRPGLECIHLGFSCNKSNSYPLSMTTATGKRSHIGS